MSPLIDDCVLPIIIKMFIEDNCYKFHNNSLIVEVIDMCYNCHNNIGEEMISLVRLDIASITI